MHEVEDSRTRSLVRIAIDELRAVLTKIPCDVKGIMNEHLQLTENWARAEKFSAIETFLMICPIESAEDVGALSDVLSLVEWKKPIKKCLLKCKQPLQECYFSLQVICLYHSLRTISDSRKRYCRRCKTRVFPQCHAIRINGVNS